MDHPSQPLRFESHTFSSVADLVAAGRRTALAGSTRHLNRDDWEPCLMWLDRLAATRVDWQPWVTAAWAQLLSDPDRSVAGCAVDALYAGLTGFVSLETLHQLDSPDALSGVEVTAPGGTSPVTLAVVLAQLDERKARLTADVSWILMARPEFEWAKLETVQDAQELARRSAKLGHNRLGGFAGQMHCLDWLRMLAVLWPARRPWVPEILRDLITEGHEQARAACEYLVTSPDHWMSAPGLASALARRPKLLEHPVDLSASAQVRCDAGTMGELSQWLSHQVTRELATSPQPHTVRAFATTHGAP